jgi:hypothetical protein
MQTMTVTIPEGLQPDWDAGFRAIRALPLEALWGTGDDLFPLEYWVDASGRLQEMDWFPSAEAAFWSISSACTYLNRQLAVFRGVCELGWPEEVIDFTAAGHRVLFTGGPSWGEPAGDLISPLIYLAETGVLSAAGFDGFTPYTNVPLAERKYEGAASERRRAEFGAALAGVLALSLANDRQPLASGLDELDRLICELKKPGGLPGLVRFAAGGLVLGGWLRQAASTEGAGLLQWPGGDLARLGDEGGLDNMPRRRSARAAAGHVYRDALEMRYWVRAVDEPDVRSDQAVRDLVTRSGVPLREAVAVELNIVLYRAIAAIADLGFDWNDRELPSPSAEPLVPGPSQTRFASLAQYQSLMMVDGADWSAAERTATTRLVGRELTKALEDLDDIRTFLADRPYDRYATIDAVADQQLLIGSPEYDERPDIAHAIGRLGRAGLLDAAGVSWWSAPDPDFRGGHVQSFVPGYGPR